MFDDRSRLKVALWCVAMMSFYFGILPASAAEEEPKLTTHQAAAPAPLTELMPDTGPEIRQGEQRFRFWWRSRWEGQARAEQVANGLTARELSEGQLLGAVEFRKPWVDFRKQEIPAGQYSLRLGFQPDLGDHQGTSPYPEFLLLVPLTAESDGLPLPVDQLRKRSAQVTGNGHVAVMLLVPGGAKQALALKTQPGGRRVLWVPGDVKLALGDPPAPMSLGVVIEGVSEAR